MCNMFRHINMCCGLHGPHRSKPADEADHPAGFSFVKVQYMRRSNILREHEHSSGDLRSDDLIRERCRTTKNLNFSS